MNATLSISLQLGQPTLNANFDWSVQDLGEVENIVLSRQPETGGEWTTVHEEVTSEKSGVINLPLEPYQNNNYHIGGSFVGGAEIDSNIVLLQLKPTVTNTGKGKGKGK